MNKENRSSPGNPPAVPVIPRQAPFAERSNTTSPLSTRRGGLGSDEFRPSQCSSIYDAECLSSTSLASIRRVSPRPIKALPPSPPRHIRHEDLRSESPLSRLETSPFLYGRGTPLHPIAEKRSVATFRTTSYSTSDLSSVKHVAPGPRARDNSSRPVSRWQLRRRQSFSLNDLDYIERRKSNAGAGTPVRGLEPVTTSDSASEIDTRDGAAYRYPHLPLYSPPPRTRTPKDLWKLIESRDRLGGRHTAAMAWVRLVQRSPSINSRRSQIQRPGVLSGLPVPDRRPSPLQPAVTVIEPSSTAEQNHCVERKSKSRQARFLGVGFCCIKSLSVRSRG